MRRREFITRYGQEIGPMSNSLFRRENSMLGNSSSLAPLSRKFSRDHLPPESDAKYILSKDSPELEFDATYPTCMIKPKKRGPWHGTFVRG